MNFYPKNRKRKAPIPLEKRFLKKVKKTEGCWEWQGSIDAGGYGMIFKSQNDRKVLRTHRVSWELHNGSIPKSLYVLHRCDNRKCCNPDHLYLGTHKDNMRDMRTRGRTHIRRGEKNSSSKLTEKQVKEIRRTKGITYEKLGRKYGVCKDTIWRVMNKIHWKHI